MGWHFHTIQMCPLCGKFYFLKLRPHFPNACDHHVVSLYKDGDSYSLSFAPARDANNHFIFLTLSIWNWNKLVEWCILNFNTRTRWSETVRSGIRIQNTKAVNDNFYIFKKQKMVGNGIIIRKTILVGTRISVPLSSLNVGVTKWNLFFPSSVCHK